MNADKYQYVQKLNFTCKFIPPPRPLTKDDLGKLIK